MERDRGCLGHRTGALQTTENVAYRTLVHKGKVKGRGFTPSPSTPRPCGAVGVYGLEDNLTVISFTVFIYVVSFYRVGTLPAADVVHETVGCADQIIACAGLYPVFPPIPSLRSSPASPRRV